MTEQEAIEKLITTAKNEIGYLEKDNAYTLYDKQMSAGKNNYTKYGYEMHKVSPDIMDYPAHWCDCFVDWCFKETFGVEMAEKMLNGFDDYTPQSATKFIEANRWYTTPKVGDQIFFINDDGKICHTGIVYKTTPKTVCTIEGNTKSIDTIIENDGCVREKSYSVKDKKIAGYGRPDYKLLEK